MFAITRKILPAVLMVVLAGSVCANSTLGRLLNCNEAAVCRANDLTVPPAVTSNVAHDAGRALPPHVGRQMNQAVVAFAVKVVNRRNTRPQKRIVQHDHAIGFKALVGEKNVCHFLADAVAAVDENKIELPPSKNAIVQELLRSHGVELSLAVEPKPSQFVQAEIPRQMLERVKHCMRRTDYFCNANSAATVSEANFQRASEAALGNESLKRANFFNRGRRSFERTRHSAAVDLCRSAVEIVEKFPHSSSMTAVN